VGDAIERYSVSRTRAAIARAEVTILVLDATEAVGDQDQRIARDVADAGRALVIALNKWDLVPPGRTQEEIRRRVAHALRFVAYAPVLPVSATARTGVSDLLATTARVAEAYGLRVGTGPLNRIVEAAEAATPPPADSRGRRVKILYATQVRAAPPTIVLFVNAPDLMPEHYRRHLERALRSAFPLEGTPVRFLLRARRERVS
jgi:GTP-binding protein